VILFFEVVVSKSPGGLQSSFEVKTVVALLRNNILVGVFPLFPDPVPLSSAVDRQSFVSLLGAICLSLSQDEHPHRVASIAYVHLIIMNYSCDTTGTYTSQLLVA
jgi:hypothetical protein